MSTTFFGTRLLTGVFLAVLTTACEESGMGPGPGPEPQPALFEVQVFYDKISVIGTCDTAILGPGDLTYQITFWAESAVGTNQLAALYTLGSSGYPSPPPLAIAEEAWAAGGNTLAASQGVDVQVNLRRVRSLSVGQRFRVAFNASEWDDPFNPRADSRMSNANAGNNYTVSGSATLSDSIQLPTGSSDPSCAMRLHYTITVSPV